MSRIILSTLNARYMHTAFGLRYLYANMGEPLRSQTKLLEFTIHQRPTDIAEKLLGENPEIIGFGVYIWNVMEVSAVVVILKTIKPDITIVLGGPEVSFYPDVPVITEQADYVISGPAELSFYQLCEQILAANEPENKFINGELQPLGSLELPYRYYADQDIKNRLIYVEASRGCPFKCEFCLSSLDKTAKAFPLESFLSEIKQLLGRGARNFKFIDRTFNLKVSSSVTILEFFLQHMCDDLYLHFEVVPDNLPDKLRDVLQRFPANSLQFEIGVQSFDPKIQKLISRHQDNDKTRENIRWLRENTGAHLHADLIFGLPEDTLENFSDSFDQLVNLRPQEIQLGILKRLRGAPINRHTDCYDMRYNQDAPYNLLSTIDIDFVTMQRVNRFARFWDLIANSGRFQATLPVILGESPFERFLRLSDKLYQRSGSTWKIALKRLFEMIFIELIDTFNINSDVARELLLCDYQKTGIKGSPDFQSKLTIHSDKKGLANKRQIKHR